MLGFRDWVESHNEAVATKCQTPGSRYHTEIHDKEISISVTLPRDLDLSKKDAKILTDNLHNVVELVLARFFLICK